MDGMKIERDARVVASDGEVGRVRHVVVDPQTREVTDVVVEHGGQEQMIPIRAVMSADRGMVKVQGKRAQYRSATGFDRGEFRGVDDERAEAETRERAARGGAPLRAAEDDAVVIGGAAATERPRRQRADTARGDDGTLVQLREEELVARKELVETGEVEIRKEVVAEQRTIEVPITREEVFVERRPVENRPAGGPIGQDEVIEVPLHEEQIRVDKRAVVYEELEVGKRVVQELETVTDTVHREVADITTEGDVDVGLGAAEPSPRSGKQRRNKGR